MITKHMADTRKEMARKIFWRVNLGTPCLMPISDKLPAIWAIIARQRWGSMLIAPFLNMERRY
jgi:hypothetical protein